MPRLTPKQAETLRAIVGHRLARGVYPTLRELGAQLGVSGSKRARELLHRLERLGYVARIGVAGRRAPARNYTLTVAGLAWVLR